MTLPPDAPGQPDPTTPGEQPAQPAPGANAWEDVADLTAPGAVPPEPAEPARRSRKGLIAGSAAALVILGGAGAWAYSALGGGGAQPEAALPASTLLYLDVDLDPSAAQKVNLLRLANRVPDLADTLGVDLDESADLKQVIAQAITRSGECEIDYAADVEPWIGDRAAVAGLPGEDEPALTVVVAVTDEKAARAAIESGLGCGEEIAPERVAFTEGFAVVTGEDVSAADVVADAAKGSLADDDVFSADMEALGETGLVSFWMDVQAAELLDDSAAGLGDLAPDMGALTKLQDYSTVAMALRANSDSLELATAVAADDDVLALQQGTGSTVAAELPGTTLFAVAAAGNPDAIDVFWDQLPDLLAATGEDAAFDDTVAVLADQYDIHLPEDLKTLLGEQIVLAVDSEGLEDFAGMSAPADLNVGLRTVGDTAALQDLADRVNSLVTMTGVDALATAEISDGLAIATNGDYADALTGGGDLGSSEAYRSVIGDEDASTVVFLDLDRLSTLLSSALPDDGAKYLEPLRALGATSRVTGDHATSTVRLSFD